MKEYIVKPKPNKFKANGLWLHLVTLLPCEKDSNCPKAYFGSLLEVNFYRYLREYCLVSEILLHPRFLIKPRGQVYKSLHWKIDFQVLSCEQHGINHGFLAETKGEALPDFLRNLQLLDYVTPAMYHRLIVVGNQGKPLNPKIHQVTMLQFKHWFESQYLQGQYPSGTPKLFPGHLQ